MNDTDTPHYHPRRYADLSQHALDRIMDEATAFIDGMDEVGVVGDQSLTIRKEDFDEVQEMVLFDLLTLLDERRIITWYTSDRDTARSTVVMRDPSTFRVEATAVWAEHVQGGAR